jgi:hypothetical protein
MAITVNALARQMVEETGMPTSNNKYVNQMERWISEITSLIMSFANWYFLLTKETVTTSNGTAEYSLTSTRVDVVAVRIPATDIEIVRVPIERLVDERSNLESAASPTRYFISGYTAATGVTKITFFPTPDAIYSVDVYEITRPATISGGTTIPIPDEFLPSLKFGVRAMYSMDDGLYQEYQAYWQTFGQSLEALKVLALSPINRDRIGRLEAPKIPSREYS